MRQRELSIDVLKIASIFAVVALHTQRNSQAGIVFNPILYYGARFAMPIFFMLNGYLMFSKTEFSFNYYKKKIINIVRVLILWGGKRLFFLAD